MDWQWLMKWVPCAWPCPSLEPARRTRGLSTPLLEGGDDEDLLSALGKVLDIYLTIFILISYFHI